MVTGSPGVAGWAQQWRYSAPRFLTTIRARTPRASPLPVPDHQDIPILDDIFLTFETQQAFLTNPRISAMIDQRLPVHHFGANELLLEIAVDGPGRFHRRAVHRDRPGAHFRFAGREKRH